MPPDSNALWTELVKGGALFIGLVFAVRYLLKELKELAAKRDLERIAERANCEQNVKELSARVKTLEDRSHIESTERESKLVVIIDKSADAFLKNSEALLKVAENLK